MNITLYKYSHERNLMNKTNYLLDSLQIQNVILKERTSIIEPILLLSNIGTDGNRAIDYNYVYIPDFERYYFIRDYIFEANQLVSLICEEDELFTYRTQLLLLTGLVTRNEYNYNVYASDDVMQYELDEGVEVTKLILQTGRLSFNVQPTASTYNIVLTCLNNQYQSVTSGYPSAYPFSTLLPSPTTYAGNKDLFTFKYIMNYTQADLFERNIVGLTEASFIKSFVIFPFEIDRAWYYNEEQVKTYYEDEIHLGDSYVSVATGQYPQYSNYAYQHIGYFNYAFSTPDYTQYEPYSRYEIYLPFVGWRDIASADLMNRDIYVYYNINLEDGSAVCQLISNNASATTNQYIIASYDCKLGVKVGVSQTNQEEIDNQTASNLLTSAVGVLTGALLITASGGSGIGAVGGALSMMGSVTGGIAKQLNLYSRGNVSISSGYQGILNPLDVYIKRTYKKPVNNLNAYASVKGRPCGKMLQLNTITGYTEISDIHLSNIKATDQEKERLLEILKNGFICG